MSTPVLYKEVGLRVRQCRKRLKMNQERLAVQLGISRATVANIETGRQGISVHQLYRLADSLGVNVTALLPAVTEERGQPDWQSLPIPQDLPVDQKAQIARVILGTVSQTPNAEEGHAPQSKGQPKKESTGSSKGTNDQRRTSTR